MFDGRENESLEDDHWPDWCPSTRCPTFVEQELTSHFDKQLRLSVPADDEADDELGSSSSDGTRLSSLKPQGVQTSSFLENSGLLLAVLVPVSLPLWSSLVRARTCAMHYSCFFLFLSSFFCRQILSSSFFSDVLLSS